MTSMLDLRSGLVGAIRDTEGTLEQLRVLLVQLDGGRAIQVPGQGAWTQGMLAQLWPQVSHLAGVRALFEVTSSHPNQAISYSQLLAASGLDHLQQKNEHARLSRVTTELFGEKRWPIQNWQSSEAAGGHMLYRMGGTVAEWWQEIAQS